MRRVRQLDVVLDGPGSHLLAVVGAEVVEDEVQASLGGMQRADVPAELQEVRAVLALLDVPVEPVGADVVSGDQMPDAVRARVGRAYPLRLRARRPALAAGLGRAWP